MKTIKALSAAAILAAFTLTASAADPVLSPKAASLRPTVVTGIANDPDLVHGRPMLGKATPTAAIVIGNSENDPNTLAMRDCVMSPRAKNDAAACEKHCKTFATK